MALGGGFFWGKATVPARRIFAAAGGTFGSSTRRFAGAGGAAGGGLAVGADHRDRQLKHHGPACERQFGSGVLLQLHAGVRTDDGFREYTPGRNERDGRRNHEFRWQCDRSDDPGTARRVQLGDMAAVADHEYWAITVKNLRVCGDFFGYPQAKQIYG